MPRPAIILLNPQMGENIGATARAMMNFGLTELRLVAPRDGWPNATAIAMAKHAAPILESATLYPTLTEALHDITRSYATCPRDHRLHKPILNLRAAAADTVAHSHNKIAWVFGPERTGLQNEDLVPADIIVQIPTAPDYSSINLAQAVILSAYELWTAHATPPNIIAPLEPPAPNLEWQQMFDHLEPLLDQSGFFKTTAIKPSMQRNLRSMFQRAGWNSQELRSFRGIITALSIRLPRN